MRGRVGWHTASRTDGMHGGGSRLKCKPHEKKKNTHDKTRQAGHDAPWVLYRLEDNQGINANINERREEYVPVRVSESEIEVR